MFGGASRPAGANLVSLEIHAIKTGPLPTQHHAKQSSISVIAPYCLLIKQVDHVQRVPHSVQILHSQGPAVLLPEVLRPRQEAVTVSFYRRARIASVRLVFARLANTLR